MQPMRCGYSLDETHTPEVVACLIPATSLRSPGDYVYGAAARTSRRHRQHRRVAAARATSESGTDDASLIVP